MSNRRRILVADDDEIILDITRTKLTQSGFDVEVASNGREALALLEVNHFDLLVTDLEMPVMDGYALIRFVRAQARYVDLPILVVTGNADVEACAAAFHAGATSFTTKPINWALISEQINYLLRNADRENALREARLAAEHATAFRDNLMAVVGHELRTPLNAVIGFAKMLCDEVYGPLGAAEYKDFAQEISTAGHRLNGLVNDALLTSRLITGAQAADISDNDALEVLKPIFGDLFTQAARARVDLNVAQVSHDIELKCDAALLQTAVRHLIQNAIDHTREATRIDVTCTTGEACVIVAVDDTGPGIDIGRLEHLHKPLVQGDDGLNRASSGMGFGLAIAKAVADLHQGHLELVNRKGGGLHAAIVIPTQRGAARPVSDAA